MKKSQYHTGREVFHNFMTEFMQESDRACVILASAEMEVRLELLFTKFLKTNAELRKDLFSFSGPLGSLSARIKFAYALNLITKEFYEILETFRGIRNKIVHKGVHVSLEEADIKTLVAKLLSNFINSDKFKTWVFQEEHLTEEQCQFRSAISFILLMIEHTIESIEPLTIEAHSCDPDSHIN